jgi:hypothetical protein
MRCKGCHSQYKAMRRAIRENRRNRKKMDEMMTEQARLHEVIRHHTIQIIKLNKALDILKLAQS